MSEVGKAIKLDHFDKDKSHAVVITRKEELPETSEHLSRLHADFLYGTKKRQIKLVSKLPRVFSRRLDNHADYAKEYYGIWSRLKKAGLPVVPTVRRVSKEEVAMTDLTADGSIFYDKNTNTNLRLMYDNAAYSAHPFDKKFLSLNTRSVIKRAETILDKANRESIALALDDPLSLLVHPDGTWDIYVLDIGGTQFDTKTVKFKNKVNLRTFKEQLESIKRYLR